ncbi:MAG: response regulator [Chitinispirillales bacterium]|jgi:putative two-component system response regulator|nr:response regulator [Chitinispirillales bacterium]
MKTIFVVDDSDVSLIVTEEALENQYRVITLPSAAKMFAMLDKILPDLILLDVFMPDIDGLATLKLLKSNERTANIPVIFLSGQKEDTFDMHDFEHGAVDFVSKPFSDTVLLNRVKMHLDINTLIRGKTDQIEKKTVQLKQSYENMILILADLVESRDRWTGGHVERTAAQIKTLMDAMARQGVYAEEIEALDIDLVVRGTRLHDLGKITIPDAILNKLGKLTAQESDIMKTHVKAGEQIIARIMEGTHDERFWSTAKILISSHHEHWDGTGYPAGLAELDIPLPGRVLALVDVYDALVSERSYKGALSHEQAVSEIMAGTGKHFDPQITEVFFNVADKFKETLAC